MTIYWSGNDFTAFFYRLYLARKKNKSFWFSDFYIFRLPLEPSSQRFITHFEIGEPFEKDGMEFAVIKIKGQSFMLHQIRKMIGMTIAVVRGQAPIETIGK